MADGAEFEFKVGDHVRYLDEDFGGIYVVVQILDRLEEYLIRNDNLSLLAKGTDLVRADDPAWDKEQL